MTKCTTSYLFQYFAVISGTLNMISVGMYASWVTPSLPILLSGNSTITITSDEGSWLITIQVIMGIVGSIACSIGLNSLGRKSIILFSCLPYFVGWMLIAFAKSTPILLTSRAIAGFSDGILLPTITIYLGEISSPKIRGMLGNFTMSATTVGSLLINALGSYLSIKTTALVSSVLPVLCFGTFVWMPESPYYWLSRGNEGKAKKSLERLTSSADVDGDLSRIGESIRKQQENTGKYLDLFTVKSNLYAFGILLFLRVLQNFSGASAISFYNQIIFKDIEKSGIVTASEATMIYFSVKIVFSCCASLMIDKVGRRLLLIVSVTGCGIALLVEGCYFHILEKHNLDRHWWIPLVALIFYAISFSLGLQSIPYVITSELLPSNIKSFAGGLLTIVFLLGISVSSKFFQVTKDHLGMYVPFYTFSACCLIGLLIIICIVPETKNKTLEDIHMEFHRTDLQIQTR